MSADPILGEGFDNLPIPPQVTTPVTAPTTIAGKAPTHAEALRYIRDSYLVRWADLTPPGVRRRAAIGRAIHDIWKLLLSHTNPRENWEVYPSQELLGHYADIGCRKTVRRHIQTLEDCGLVSLTQQGRQGTHYRLHPERMTALPRRPAFNPTQALTGHKGPQCPALAAPLTGHGDTLTGHGETSMGHGDILTGHGDILTGHKGGSMPHEEGRMKIYTEEGRRAVPDFRLDGAASKNDRTENRQDGIPAATAVGAAAGDRREWYTIPQTDRAVGSPSQVQTDRAVSTVGGVPLVTVPQPAVPPAAASACGSRAPVPIRRTFAQSVLPLLIQRDFLDDVPFGVVTQRLGGAQPGRLLTTAVQDGYFRSLLSHLDATEFVKAVQRAAAREASATAPWPVPGDRDGEIAFALSTPLLSGARGNPGCEAWLRQMATARILLPALAVLQDGTWTKLIAQNGALAPASQSSQSAPSRLRAS